MSFKAWKEVSFSRGFKRSKTSTNKVSWHNFLEIKLHYHLTSLHYIQVFLMVSLLSIRGKEKISLLRKLFSEFNDVSSMNSFGIYYQSFHFVWWKKKTDGGKRDKFNLKVLFMLWWNLFFMLKISEPVQLGCNHCIRVLNSLDWLNLKRIFHLPI